MMSILNIPSLARWVAPLCLGAFATGFGGVAHSAAQDHPLLSGMPSYKIDADEVNEYGKYPGQRVFMCAPSRQCNATDPGFGADGKLIAEGKTTMLRYANQGNGQTLAVARNYENAVKAAGGRKLTWQDGYEGEQVFLVDKAGRRTWIVLENSYNSSYKLTFIEAKAMEQVVSAGELADSIKKQGFATVYLNFANNSSALQADGQQTVAQIVSLMMADKSLRLSIQGHTDNVGSAASNKTLSQARAESVVKALVQAKVDAKRLEAKGFGSEVPVADNRTEEGKAKNRRVELVKLK